MKTNETTNMNDDLPECGMFNVVITYGEMIAYPWVKRMNDRINRKHPVQTTQIFDFRQNLFAYV